MHSCFNVFIHPSDIMEKHLVNYHNNRDSVTNALALSDVTTIFRLLYFIFKSQCEP